MSTITNPRLPPGAGRPEDDPFRYGVRYRRVYRDDGTFTVKAVPLRQEDLLFPEEEDRPVVTDGHQTDLVNLLVSFRTQLRNTPGAEAVGELRIDFASPDPDIQPLGPDVAVIFGVREHRDWSTFHVGQEGTRPSLVVEITSPATRTNDLEIKVDLYYRVGVQWYVIVDREERGGGIVAVHLLGYQRGDSGFVEMTPNERGWLWLEAVGAWLGIESNQAVCYHPEGTRIRTHAELTEQVAAEVRARLEAEQRAEVERRIAAEARARAEAAEQRSRELEAELARLRGQGR
jgi:Uma2 family endonuclease